VSQPTLRPTWEGHSDRIRTDATISPDGIYRYDLVREYDPEGPWCLFIGLNSSTADATQDDPTIRREIDFAHGMGFPNLVKCNLYALRSTDPKGIVTSKVDPVGKDNDPTMGSWVPRVGRIVFAWGYSAKVGKRMLTRAWEVRLGLRSAIGALAFRGAQVPTCGHLGLTEGKEHQPRHPLYLAKTTEFVEMAP
jgi:hypothetical protein